MSGNRNTQYTSSALNFCLALDASENHKGYNCFAVNLGLISLFHARRIFSKKIMFPLVNIRMDVTVENICNHF